MSRIRSIRFRFAIAFAFLIVLAGLNIAAFYWGARERERVFGDLGEAIEQHRGLVELQAEIEDQHRQVRVFSELVGVEEDLAPAELTRILDRIDAVRTRARSMIDNSSTSRLRPVLERTIALADAWTEFYDIRSEEPGEAIAHLVLVAEPLAQELLREDYSTAIQAQRARVDRATEAFIQTERTSSRIVWLTLLMSGVLGLTAAASLSRDLLRAISSLKSVVDRYGAGDFEHRVEIRNCEELEDVGHSLNLMAERLQRARSELQLRNAELADLAFHDPLTRLANRSVFRDRVASALADVRSAPAETAVLFLDLDNFKRTNDTLGHGLGDRLLADAASRLASCVRADDLVGRLGGDEFAILLPHTRDLEHALRIARRAIEVMEEPFELDGRTAYVTVSVGVARGREGQDAEELIRDADVAMYQAKKQGTGSCAVFAPAMHTDLVDRLALEAELREALRRGDLRLVYQPIVELSTGRVTGFEALARWHHSQRGAIPPTIFIPIAEDAGLIMTLGKWVLGEACAEAASWGEAGLGDGDAALSVNVSGHQLEDERFVDDVAAVLESSGLDPDRLVLEITESSLVRNRESALVRLQALKKLGVRLAIDDFGTGYSSLAYLKHFPIDVLKIDKAFVDSVARGGNDAALTRAIIALGEMLELSTVAEGIEDTDQLEELQRLGCGFGQGFIFAEPRSPSDVAALLRKRFIPWPERPDITAVRTG